VGVVEEPDAVAVTGGAVVAAAPGEHGARGLALARPPPRKLIDGPEQRGDLSRRP
jgi:hypothetical protein